MSKFQQTKPNDAQTKKNYRIKRLHQVGLIQKWLEDYLPKKDRCWKKQNTLEVNNHTVNLDDMQGSFFVLLIGNNINNSNLQSKLF